MVTALLVTILGACAVANTVERGTPTDETTRQVPLGKEFVVSDPATFKTAVLGGGCFWCLEAVYELEPGVAEVENGYAGGSTKNPSYEQVGSGLTGHAEVVKIRYDPAVLDYARLLEIFWIVHDPTSLNRQGADIGEQYRSIILYGDEEERRQAEAALREIAKKYSDPIVTELEPLREYWPAEEYHQDYFRRNPDQAYCRFVVKPKVDKYLDLTL